MKLPFLLISFARLLAFGAAIFPEDAQGITTRHISGQPGVSITYKETKICESKAKAWAGYVHLPSWYLSEIQTADPYNVSMFFWYFEARNSPSNASTGIYLAGGPGAPSIGDIFSGAGSCYINPDSNSTKDNAWSWNNNMNMLYIDQPVSSGYSYTQRIRSTLNMMFLGNPVTETGITPMEAYGGSVPPGNTTFLHGTFSEQSPDKTINSTLSAAKTLWHFTQIWFPHFPEYKTSDKRVSIWGNSYAGFYVPTTATYTVQQNSKIRQGARNGTIIPIDTVGWTNGCVDMLYQGEWYPEQAYNNTYGLQVITRGAYEEALRNFTKPGGCRDQISECRRLGDLYDPEQLNINANVTDACVGATLYCFGYVLGAYEAASNRSNFDMAHLKPDPFPASYANGFFNQAWVQRELGVAVNYTSSLLANNVLLYAAGDPVRVAGREALQRLLAAGVQVVMMYGDRDYRCPWNGAERLSLGLEWAGAEGFRGAGYEYVKTSGCASQGVVRQHGGLSFVRIFDAGHNAQGYQPEIVSRLVSRAIAGKDLATGKHATTVHGANYTTHGPSSSFGIKNKLPDPPAFECSLWNVASSCTQEQYDALMAGTAEVENYMVVKPAGGSPGSIIQVL
ncbi:Peptidase S10, serine carboxypeptidase [Cordyceps fumosorosea ARSEF 2679]|uniref:Peptidase S10, serine carboxypeptidase n=1 Tax=Cordyceps fumosorosea (strain ARSEF 2679) TaxID=1081104 RepID=A0A168BRB4_CORFA|nr:Peptidase S10, serine carboxypeptidase [Cordyceps fumosorosea ARSEF 2679]OAA70447.1 Peptidase S10, serine carboxypeptidase [Cordyceps fumosorosea ARSEF 2679]